MFDLCVQYCVFFYVLYIFLGTVDHLSEVTLQGLAHGLVTAVSMNGSVRDLVFSAVFSMQFGSVLFLGNVGKSCWSLSISNSS